MSRPAISAGIGRDPRAVTLPAPAGHAGPDPSRPPPHTVVIGAGIAGLTAATGLAERGIQVTVLERAPYLGGRVAGWSEPIGEHELAVNRGFHAFFRQYYNLRALLARTDPHLSRLTPVSDYPLIDSHGRRDSFRRLPRTPPWNALVFALRSPTFRTKDLFALRPRAAAPLADVSVPDIYRQLDNTDVATFLNTINFPTAARHLAFEVFSRSFFAPPEQMSAAELATMFHLYFLGSAEGLIFDVPTSNYDTALWDPLHAHLTALGARIHHTTAATRIQPHPERGWRVHTHGGIDVGTDTLDADAVVLATHIPGLQEIVRASPGLADTSWRHRIAGLRTAPPFLVHRMWLDRPLQPHRPAFLATGGLPPLDNISRPDRYEQQARDWARTHHGAVIELHAYALTPPEESPEHEWRAAILRDTVAQARRLWPELRDARPRATRSQWHHDCPLFPVGGFAGRPCVNTPFPGLVLAGDSIRIDLPVALMERAAATGWHAANTLLQRWNITGHPLHSVPTRGRNPLLRRLAHRTAQDPVPPGSPPRR